MYTNKIASQERLTHFDSKLEGLLSFNRTISLKEKKVGRMVKLSILIVRDMSHNYLVSAGTFF